MQLYFSCHWIEWGWKTSMTILDAHMVQSVHSNSSSPPQQIYFDVLLIVMNVSDQLQCPLFLPLFIHSFLPSILLLSTLLLNLQQIAVGVFFSLTQIKVLCWRAISLEMSSNREAFTQMCQTVDSAEEIKKNFPILEMSLRLRRIWATYLIANAQSLY